MFCSNIAPSLSSGNHLYKAEYRGRSCRNKVLAITFDWSALATAFWMPFLGISHLPNAHLSYPLAQSTFFLEIQVPGVGTWHNIHHQNLAIGVSLKELSKCSLIGMLISGRQCTPVKSYGPFPIRAISPRVFGLWKYRWFPELDEKVTFPQNT